MLADTQRWFSQLPLRKLRQLEKKKEKKNRGSGSVLVVFFCVYCVKMWAELPHFKNVANPEVPKNAAFCLLASRRPVANRLKKRLAVNKWEEPII